MSRRAVRESMNRFASIATHIAAVLALTPSTASAEAPDLCAELKNARIHIVANGFSGVIGPEGQGMALIKSSTGAYQFATTSQWQGSPPSKVTGSCIKGEMRFLRRGDHPEQSYKGVIFSRETVSSEVELPAGYPPPSKPFTYREAAGTFTQAGSSLPQGWRAWIQPVLKTSVCDISGQLLNGDSYVNITNISLRSKENPAEVIIDPVKPDAAGKFAFRNVPAGVYLVRADIRADTTRHWEPASREVVCKGPVSGIDFSLK